MPIDIAALAERARALHLIGRTTIMRGLGLSDHQAKKVAAHLRQAATPPTTDPAAHHATLRLAVLHALSRTPHSVEELADLQDCFPARVRTILAELHNLGHPIEQTADGRYIRNIDPAPAQTVTPLPTPDGRGVIRVGFVADTHLGSTQQQITHLHEAYRRLADLGIDTIYHAGDVLAGINVYKGQHNEIWLHSYDEQLDYAVEHYPKIAGVTTKAIAGNHDLRGLKDGGSDPIRMLAMRRPDIEYLGPYSAWATAGDFSLYLLHPDGGSAYAVSYKLQKLIESFQGGRKPHVAVVGHWHQAAFVRQRNVKAFFPGCFEAQPNSSGGASSSHRSAPSASSCGSTPTAPSTRSPTTGSRTSTPATTTTDPPRPRPPAGSPPILLPGRPSLSRGARLVPLRANFAGPPRLARAHLSTLGRLRITPKSALAPCK